MIELIWEGKCVDGKRQSPVRVALPFQTIETVNESAADRRRTLDLFAAGRPTEWRNRLIWGDKKYVLPSLLPEFAGKVNLIYIDPPFDTGADFSFTAKVPNHPDSPDDDSFTFTKEPSIIEHKAYRDTWGRGLDSYLQWFCETAVLLHELLHENGSIYAHLDYHVAHYVKVTLDEIFGSNLFYSEIVWQRRSGTSSAVHQSNRFGTCTDSILYYAKSEAAVFNPQYNFDDPTYKAYIDKYFTHTEEDGRRFRDADLSNPAPRPNLMYEYKGVKPPKNGWAISREKMEQWDKEGRLYFTNKGGLRRKCYVDELEGKPIQNLWLDISPVNSQAAERLNYPTQKPEPLLERIIKASSNENDLVLDCFCGSGTTAAVAEKLNRRWIACDLGRFAIRTARKRLLSIPGVKPFSLQNLGKYERQAWQSTEFQTKYSSAAEEQRQREAAYRKFILDLYHATPLSGQTWLHGLKSGRVVHVGAVDAPVTISDVKAVARETWKVASGREARKAAADILGWEFAFELNETARQVAAESRVDVTFKKIPREVLEKKAVEQGDIKFFELGALSVEPKQKGRELILKLTDFVIPVDDVPEEARKAIKHWSQMIDYWAVDWDFREDTFHNQWQSYRTRQEPDIELSAKHEYEVPGSHKVVVKVIDILGNDTTKTLDIQVK
jgi:DNA modification methylase